MNPTIGNGTRVLVVDDDEDVRQVVTDRLEQVGFVVVQACDGLRALVEMQQRHFDVVVTDYKMPHLNGLNLLRQCQLAYPWTQVIIMSAGLDAAGEIAAARNAFHYIRKPFDADQLITVICQAARLSKTLAPPSSGSASDTDG